jgi:hypothetical protein
MNNSERVNKEKFRPESWNKKGPRSLKSIAGKEYREINKGYDDGSHEAMIAAATYEEDYSYCMAVLQNPDDKSVEELADCLNAYLIEMEKAFSYAHEMINECGDNCDNLDSYFKQIVTLPRETRNLYKSLVSTLSKDKLFAEMDNENYILALNNDDDLLTRKLGFMSDIILSFKGRENGRKNIINAIKSISGIINHSVIVTYFN